MPTGMRRFRFVTVDVFTAQRFGGNPLAVFPDARGLTDTEMQALAAEFNLSETTFVLPPTNPAHTARVRIFNRVSEMPFAGHPNVGTALVLARTDPAGTLRFEEPAGLVQVEIARDAAGQPLTASIAAPQPLSTGPAMPVPDVAACAGLDPADVRTDVHAPVSASVGIGFVIAQVAGPALTRAAPDLAAFRRARQAAGAEDRLGLFLYARDGQSIRARMFAPLSGTIEDPATGSASAALAALLLSVTADAGMQATVTQGVEMGRPSLLHVAARRTQGGIRATVAGGCVPVLEGEALL